MKSISFSILFLAITAISVAKIKPKDVVGTWNYVIQTSNEQFSGELTISQEKKGELSGLVVTSNGSSMTCLNLELRTDDVLYFEVQTGNDVIKVTLKIHGEELEGKGVSYRGEFPITGTKQQ